MKISYEDFRKVDIRVGSVLSVINNEKSKQNQVLFCRTGL